MAVSTRCSLPPLEVMQALNDIAQVSSLELKQPMQPAGHWQRGFQN